MKPIQTAFKIAGELLSLPNKYRDTLGSAALAAYAGSQLLQGDGNVVSMSVAVWGTREACRAAAWFISPPLVAGVSRGPINRERNIFAASLVGSALDVGAVGLFNSHPASSVVMLGGALTMGSIYWGLRMTGAGLRDIPKLYFDKQTGMWDWPSKQGGGMTETKKLLASFADFGKGLVPDAAGLNPAPIPVSPGNRFPPRRQRTAAL